MLALTLYFDAPALNNAFRGTGFASMMCPLRPAEDATQGVSEAAAVCPARKDGCNGKAFREVAQY
jgi:hypothetical protein